MSECKDERLGLGSNPSQPSFKIPLSSIKAVLQLLKCAIEAPKPPLPFISAAEISIGVRFRTGISKSDTVSRIINKLTSAGIDIGPNNDGTPNKSNASKRVIAEEILDEIMYKSKVEIGIPPGTIITQVTGTAGPVPVAGSGVNPSFIKLQGIIR